MFVWQPNYWEHIIRGDRGLERIRKYITANPQCAKWAGEANNGVESEEEFWRRVLDTNVLTLPQ